MINRTDYTKNYQIALHQSVAPVLKSKDYYSISRPDLQAQALFEKMDKVKNKKEKIKFSALEIQQIKALKKAHKEFDQSNKAYIRTINKKSKEKTSLAKDLANKKYQNFLAHYETCLNLITRNCSESENQENKRFRREISEHAFYNEMAMLFHIPSKELDLVYDHGVIIDDVEKHLQSDIKDAIKIATDDQRLNELTQYHELAMLKLSTFSHVLDNHDISQNNTFSTAFIKMLAARKLFIEALAKGVNVEERLDTLKETIYHYKDQLELINTLLANNPLPKIKNLVAAKDKRGSDELEQEGMEKMMRHINTAELIEGIDQQPNRADSRAEYFMDKLNEFEQAILQEKAREAAKFIKEKELFSSIALHEKSMFSSKLNLLSDFIDEKNINSPQQFLQDKLNAYKQAELKLSFEKAAYEKKYAALITFCSHKSKKHEEALEKFNQEKAEHEKRSVKLGKSKNYKEAEENLKKSKKQVELGEEKLKKAQRQMESAKENLSAAQKTLELANHFIFRMIRLTHFSQKKNESTKSKDSEKSCPNTNNVASPQCAHTPQPPIVIEPRIKAEKVEVSTSLFSSAKPAGKLTFGKSIEPLKKKKDSLILLHNRKLLEKKGLLEKLRGISIFMPNKTNNPQAAIAVLMQEEDHTPRFSFRSKPSQE